jgi:predicted metal-binding protein
VAGYERDENPEGLKTEYRLAIKAVEPMAKGENAAIRPANLYASIMRTGECERIPAMNLEDILKALPEIDYDDLFKIRSAVKLQMECIRIERSIAQVQREARSAEVMARIMEDNLKLTRAKFTALLR